MTALREGEIEVLLRAYFVNAIPEWQMQADARPLLCSQLAVYLELLLRWNARMNLSAIRDAKQIVRRHFGESLFAAWHLGTAGTVLDVGSGAGFPGVLVQLWHPNRQVTLAESQGKKATFLRELVRTLGLGMEIWGSRVELMPASRSFEDVVMRAVDEPSAALQEGRRRARSSVWVMATDASMRDIADDGDIEEKFCLPDRRESAVFRLRPVPRGTPARAEP